MYPVSSSRPLQGQNKHQAVAVHHGRSDALVDGAWCGLPCQATLLPVELQALSGIPGFSFSERKDITVPDIPLETCPVYYPVTVHLLAGCLTEKIHVAVIGASV